MASTLALALVIVEEICIIAMSESHELLTPAQSVGSDLRSAILDNRSLCGVLETQGFRISWRSVTGDPGSCASVICHPSSASRHPMSLILPYRDPCIGRKWFEAVFRLGRRAFPCMTTTCFPGSVSTLSGNAQESHLNPIYDCLISRCTARSYKPTCTASPSDQFELIRQREYPRR